MFEQDQTPETTTTTPTEDGAAYKLTLKGEGMTLERDVTKNVALAVINVALGGGQPGSAGGQRTAGSGIGGVGPAPAEAPGGERVTPGEFIEERNANSNPEKIVAFGAYLRDTRGRETFTREDIKAMFREAHETAPANFGRDFRNALSNRWIAPEEGSTSRYWVTSTGTKAVENQFAKARKARRRSPRSTGGDED